MNDSLQILILFCLRILILRLSPATLNEVFRNIWPILLTLLMQIFDPKKKERIKSKINVHLAGLKLIELLSICNIEEFYLYQWIFIFDYYGVQIDNLSRRNEPEIQTAITPFKFSPYIANCLPPNMQIDYLGNSMYEKGNVKTESSAKVKRRILITQNHLETEFELQAKAHELLAYLVYVNQTRVYVDPEDIESLIQGDFIGMYEFIKIDKGN